MTLNPSKGNMYEFITHTWNPIKGKCYPDCSYCYMKAINPNISSIPIHLVESELIGNFPINSFIFIDSSADLFAEDVQDEWITKVLDFCAEASNKTHPDRKPKFLIQSKNPKRILDFKKHPLFLPENNQVVVCTTIETNRHYQDIMNNAPLTSERANAMGELASMGIKTYVTIEPIMDFDLEEMVTLIKMCKPEQVNIGKNTSKTVELPHPTIGKLVNLIMQLLSFTKVKVKKNVDGEMIKTGLIQLINKNYSYEKTF